MDKKTYKVLKALTFMPTAKVGDLIDLPEVEAKDLVTGGYFEEIMADPVKAALGEAMKELNDAVTKAITDAIKAAAVASKKMVPGITDVKTLDGTDPKGGFKSFSHFAHDLYKAGPRGDSISDSLQKWVNDCGKKAVGSDEMTEGSDADGGALIPPEFRTTLLQNALEASIIRGRALTIPMATNTISIPAINETTHANSSFFGGITPKKPAEAGQKTATKPKVGKVTLTLHKLIGLAYVTDELLEDSPMSLEAILTSLFGQAIAFQADDDYINGSGAGEPLGLLKSACVVEQAAETSQTTLTVVSQNVLKMWSRMYPAGQANAIWLINNDVFPAIAGMTIGSYTAAWIPPATGLSGPMFGTLLGRPMFMTEKCQTLGYPGDIILVDPTQYLIGQKGSGAVQSATSIHLRFDYDEVAFRFVMRHDGQCWWTSALTPAHSSNTLSPVVTLAARH
jgi:HK97 family phage major capsid protein